LLRQRRFDVDSYYQQEHLPHALLPRAFATPSFLTVLALAYVHPAFAQSAPAPAAPGPTIELAPEDREPPAKSLPIISFGAGRAPEADLVRSLAEQRFRSAAESLAHTSVGGYGELQVTGYTSAPDASRQWTAEARRVVLFVAHEFTQDLRVYTELELEYVKEAEIEQAYVDYRFAHDYLGARAGLILVPMGITNEVHEPPVFNGVARPSVETVIIPTTWREIGAGFFGHPIEPLRYEVYAMAGLNPAAFSAAGLAGASGEGELGSTAKGWGAAARLEYEPILGLVLGASGYGSDAGPNLDGNAYRCNGKPVTFPVPVVGYSADARMRKSGVEWKMLYTEWFLPAAGALMEACSAPPPTGGKSAPLVGSATQPLGSHLRGAYVELGYDVLHPFHVSHQIVPFARLEGYDTQVAVPKGYTANQAYNLREFTFGVGYRPIREVVVKTDYLLRFPESGPKQTQLSFGIGFMY
jgi:hypothetical protein